VIGAIVDVIAATSGSKHKASTTTTSGGSVAAYLTSHVAKGTPIAVLGSVSSEVPADYTKVSFTESNVAQLSSLTYAVAPDPVSSLSPALASYLQGHGALVTVDPGKSSLWKLAPTPKVVPTTATPSTVAPTTVAPTTVAPTTVAPTTTPTTVPPTTTPPTTVVTTTTPPTTTATTTPPTTAPPTTTPSTTPTTVSPGSGGGGGTTTTPGGGGPSPVAGSVPVAYTVQHGQSMWTIAQSVVQQHFGAGATQAQVAHYWAQLVQANINHLPVDHNANLIFSGTILTLPAI
jgi:hypothetical protein